MKTRIMLDLETLGTKPGSVLLSIGAVKFDRQEVRELMFHLRINPQSCITVGLKPDVSTMMWWLQQSDEARAGLFRSDIPVVGLSEALQLFSDWVLCEDVDPSKLVIELWGNGANFDNALLGAAYDACGLLRPWKFWNDRCYRTLKALHPNLPMARSGTHHNALDDARSQALHLISLPSFQAMCDREEEAVP